MQRTGCSPRLLDYSMKHEAELFTWIAPKYGRQLLENCTEDSIDLLEYLESYFYDPVWYWDTLSVEKGEVLPGRLLRISHRVGAGMY